MITTFGEIMLRLTPNNMGNRLSQTNELRLDPGGSASNVAVAISNLGLDSRFITRLPDNNLSKRIIRYLRQEGVDHSGIVFGGKRIGVYWTEMGVGPRNSHVIYDREDSSFAQSDYNNYNWNEILNDTDWFHFTGISPAVSSSVSSLLKRLINGLKIPYSVDLNYRSLLWNWCDRDAAVISETMMDLCKSARLIAGNETDFTQTFGIETKYTNLTDNYNHVSEFMFNKFVSMQYMVISNRVSHSATLNEWNGYFFVKDSKGIKCFVSETYRIDTIYDRVGTGDSFVAGILYGIHSFKGDYQRILDFATALSALNHTTNGDSSGFDCHDVTNAIKSKGSGRIVR